jgi:hypothetical protein
MNQRPAYSRPRQPGSKNSAGAGIGIFGLFLVAVFFIWPFAVWHGCKYGEDSCGAASEWVWNAKTWIACGIWWGSIPLIIAALAALGKPHAPRPVPPTMPPAPPLPRPKRTRPVKPRPSPLPPSVPPACLHRSAVPVDNYALGRLAWWCPGCETQLDPGHRASELTPDASWPPVRKANP